MLDQSTRNAILKLGSNGHGPRAIARALNVSRGAVRKVLASESAEVPRLVRAQKAEEYREEIVAQFARCKGNLVRVHEELIARGAIVSYQALTAFCRRHGIGYAPPKPSGSYYFAPGQEMQHDTSPHEALIGGKLRHVQTASLVMCYSRMLFIQCYPNFDRFICKAFLTDALTYFGGAATRCMIDNTHVVVLRGTGANMVPVPEMEAFGNRFGFKFVAHEKGDANRSARVEGHFPVAENNFLAGREFTDWRNINDVMRTCCDTFNAKFSRHLHATRRELFAAEQASLKPLPIYIPEVYVLHQRIVDHEGYVNIRCNRYSAPYQLIGRSLEIRETKDRVDLYEGPRMVGSHAKVLGALYQRLTEPAHRPPRGEGSKARQAQPSSEEVEIVRRIPALAEYVTNLRKHRTMHALRALARLVREYPQDAVITAVGAAQTYGMYDIDRLERMVLRAIAADFFVLSADAGDKR
jgi:transposase